MTFDRGLRLSPVKPKMPIVHATPIIGAEPTTSVLIRPLKKARAKMDARA